MEHSVGELVALERQLLEEAPQAKRPEDREWFTLLRSSQLEAWLPALRESWRQDLLAAKREGRNPVNERYVYTLAQTDPARSAALRAGLPEASMEKLWLVDWICQAQTAWQEALAEKYPGLVRRAGSGAAYEAGLRGELMAYSVNTLRLYASQVERTEKAGGNLCGAVLENAVRRLGFASMEEAEERIAAAQGVRAAPV